MMKLLITIAIAASALAALVFGMNALLVVDDLAGCTQPNTTNPKCAPADAIVAVSGGDTTARTAEAIRLYKEDWAPWLVFSGAALDPQSSSNAQAMRRQALNAGVPDYAILLDEQALDTADNASRTLQLLTRNADRIILVTSPYHQRRAGIEFERTFGSQTTIVNHPTPTDRLWSRYWWTTPHGWWLATSESVKTLIVMVLKK